MRGVGWDYATADIRHGKMTWLPTTRSRYLHRCSLSFFPCRNIVLTYERINLVLYKDLPMTMISWYIITLIYTNTTGTHEDLNFFTSAILTLAHGVFLFAMFAMAYDVTAALAGPLNAKLGQYSTNNLAYWPTLNSQDLLYVCTVRQFWSRSWHRLFARMFLVIFASFLSLFVIMIHSISVIFRKNIR